MNAITSNNIMGWIFVFLGFLTAWNQGSHELIIGWLIAAKLCWIHASVLEDRTFIIIPKENINDQETNASE